MKRCMIKDIVCGMLIEESKVSARSNYRRRVYSFCSLLCKKKFDYDPEKYIQREKTENKCVE